MRIGCLGEDFDLVVGEAMFLEDLTSNTFTCDACHKDLGENPFPHRLEGIYFGHASKGGEIKDVMKLTTPVSCPFCKTKVTSINFVCSKASEYGITGSIFELKPIPVELDFEKVEKNNA